MSKRKRIALAVLLLVGTAFFGIFVVETIRVEMSPVGRYYHYTYEASVSRTPPGANYTMLIPTMVNLNEGNAQSFQTSDLSVSGSVTLAFQTMDNRTGLNVTGSGDASMGTKWSYDALKHSDDHATDKGSTLSTWNGTETNSSHPVDRIVGQVWVFSSVNGTHITIMFEEWYKSWHSVQGVLVSGNERGGGGHSYYIDSDLVAGWNTCDVERHETMVE